MLSHFKELCLELDSNDIDYDEITKQIDFCRCLRPMKKTEFSNYISREREGYHKLRFASRIKVHLLFESFINKQANMESDLKWKNLSME